jgi:hypothetical protein
MGLTNATTMSYPPVQKASLKSLSPGGPSVMVHFNPASLVYTVENSSVQQKRDPKRRQHISHCSAKLTMDLQFDTTDSGVDVRQSTNQVASFMESSASANKNNKANQSAPPVLSFDWGAYHFQGFMESFKETIDFFSADGIPLRALVSIGLARQDEVFDPTSDTANTAGGLAPTTASVVPTGDDDSVADTASKGGDPNATRALASANGIENPRFTGGAALAVSSGIQLNAPVAFVASASVGGGIGVSGGLGIGVSAGAGVSAGFGAGASAGAGFSIGGGASAGAGFGISAGASAGLGISAGAGISVSGGAGAQVSIAAGGGALFGSTASAGVPATLGAFAGLETGRVTVSTTAHLDPLRMLPATVGSNVAVGANASFGLGGVAMSPTGFSADVGASGGVSGALVFDSD